jgi:hypothetical protein
MHIPSVPGHLKLAQDAQGWLDVLNSERAAPSDETGANAVAAAIAFAGLTIAAAIERAGLGATMSPRAGS